jgi:hypothetical protein
VNEKKECLIGDGLDLIFSEFYFVKAQPFVITSRFNRGDANSGKEVDTHLLLDALDDSSRYGIYSVGQKPELIPEDCWRTMSKAGGAARGLVQIALVHDPRMAGSLQRPPDE